VVQQFRAAARSDLFPEVAGVALDGLQGAAKPGKRWLIGRRGRAAEGGGLLNRYTVNIRIEGSNPSVSANSVFLGIHP
jgi:hypothetical protein